MFGRAGRVLAACALATVAAACGVASGSGAEAGADGRLRVVATTTQVADFARQVGGDRAEVTGVLKPNVDPHDYEPSPADLTTIAFGAGAGGERRRRRAVARRGHRQLGVLRSGRRRQQRASGSARATARTPRAGTPRPTRTSGRTRGTPRSWSPTSATRSSPPTPPMPRSSERNAAAYLDQLDAARRRRPARDRLDPGRTDAGSSRTTTRCGYYFDRYGLARSSAPSSRASTRRPSCPATELADLVAKIRRPAGSGRLRARPRCRRRRPRRSPPRRVCRSWPGEDALYGDTLGPEGSAGGDVPGAWCGTTRPRSSRPCDEPALRRGTGARARGRDRRLRFGPRARGRVRGVVHPGQAVALIGPNGAGKSTLIKADPRPRAAGPRAAARCSGATPVAAPRRRRLRAAGRRAGPRVPGLGAAGRADGAVPADRVAAAPGRRTTVRAPGRRSPRWGWRTGPGTASGPCPAGSVNACCWPGRSWPAAPAAAARRALQRGRRGQPGAAAVGARPAPGRRRRGRDEHPRPRAGAPGLRSRRACSTGTRSASGRLDATLTPELLQRTVRRARARVARRRRHRHAAVSRR